MKKLKKTLLGLLVALTLVTLGLSFLFAHMAIYPVWYRHYHFIQRDAQGHPKGGQAEPELPPCSHYQDRVYKYCHDPKADLGLAYENVVLTSPILTTGWWVRVDANSRRGTVVLVHGGGADKRAMLKHVRYLHEAGFETLLIDCFNHGVTGGNGRGISFGLRESQSILAAAEFAKKNEPKLPVIVMGTSQGGFSVLKAASLDEKKNIDAVISENPYISLERILLEFDRFFWVEKSPKFVKRLALFWISKWIGAELKEVDVNSFADRLQGIPIFLIHGDADKVVDLKHAEEIFKLIEAHQPSPQSNFWVIAGGKHEFLWNEFSEVYQKRILEWLARVKNRSSI